MNLPWHSLDKHVSISNILYVIINIRHAKWQIKSSSSLKMLLQSRISFIYVIVIIFTKMIHIQIFLWLILIMKFRRVFQKYVHFKIYIYVCNLNFSKDIQHFWINNHFFYVSISIFVTKFRFIHFVWSHWQWCHFASFDLWLFWYDNEKNGRYRRIRAVKFKSNKGWDRGLPSRHW